MSDDLKAVIDFAERRCEPSTHDIETVGLPAGLPAVVPVFVNGKGEAHSLKRLADEWRQRPERRRGTIEVTTVDSFVELVNRDSGPNSVIFADDGDSPQLVAVLDFHAAGITGDPSFCENRVRYAFPLSDEWQTWNARNGEKCKMDQATFAEFIENNYGDVGEPSDPGSITREWTEKRGVTLAGPATIMTLSRGLAARVEENVVNKTNRETGESAIMYTVEHKTADGAAALSVPSAFHLRIPVLRGQGAYSIPVRLRYRLSGGKATWFYEMHKPELFLLAAVDEYIERVQRPSTLPADTMTTVAVEGDTVPPATALGCGLPVIMGAPPAVGGA